MQAASNDGMDAVSNAISKRWSAVIAALLNV